MFGLLLLSAGSCGWPRPGMAGAGGDGDRETAGLIEQLGDRSFAVRADASRRLCMLGPAARAALESAARSEDVEVALRARALLEVLDQLFFAGCEIEIAASKTQIQWDQAVDLTLVVRNPTEFPARLPFAASASPAPASSPEAAQVAHLLDLTDFLEVIDPSGSPVTIHVDAVNSDPDIAAVVRDRAEAGPTSVLQPGGSLRYASAEMNRGWARYAMLREGSYRITLVYQPEWSDEEFTRAGVGALRSNTVEVLVSHGPPTGVVGPGASPLLTRTLEQAQVVVRIGNRQDVPIRLNTNFGPGGPPWASFRWIVYCEGQWQDGALSPAAVPAGGFSRDKLLELGPGEIIELARADVTALRRAAKLVAGQPLFVRASYSNRCDRAWQSQQQDRPAALEPPLPLRLLCTSLNTEPLRID